MMVKLQILITFFNDSHVQNMGTIPTTETVTSGHEESATWTARIICVVVVALGQSAGL